MDRLVIGLVRTSHGLKGHLKVHSLSGEVDHFFGLEEVTIRKNGRERIYAVEEFKLLGEILLMKLRGIDNPEDAKTLAAAEILVSRDLAAPLEDGEFYQADLVGCRVVHQGKDLGVVKSIFEGGAADLLEVVTEAGIYMVPFQKHYIGTVDLKAKTLELLAPWLLQ
jgi:16S rRNA processing protein RimM